MPWLDQLLATICWMRLEDQCFQFAAQFLGGTGWPPIGVGIGDTGPTHAIDERFGTFVAAVKYVEKHKGIL